MGNITEIRPSGAPPADKRDISHATCEILAALAILNMYIAALPPVTPGKDRFILWTVRDKLEEAYAIVDMS